jgi:acetolactate synthase small subunit
LQSKSLQNEDVVVDETYEALNQLQSFFSSLKEAVKVGALRETRIYGRALCLLSLNRVASDKAVRFLKLFSAQWSQISERPM